MFSDGSVKTIYDLEIKIFGQYSIVSGFERGFVEL
jgi:hypothetical protein